MDDLVQLVWGVGVARAALSGSVVRPVGARPMASGATMAFDGGGAMSAGPVAGGDLWRFVGPEVLSDPGFVCGDRAVAPGSGNRVPSSCRRRRPSATGLDPTADPATPRLHAASRGDPVPIGDFLRCGQLGGRRRRDGQRLRQVESRRRHETRRLEEAVACGDPWAGGDPAVAGWPAATWCMAAIRFPAVACGVS